jgi:putative aminopeptidase FrvX
MENTHGYEIIHQEAIANTGRLIAAFLSDPGLP